MQILDVHLQILISGQGEDRGLSMNGGWNSINSLVFLLYCCFLWCNFGIHRILVVVTDWNPFVFPGIGSKDSIVDSVTLKYTVLVSSWKPIGCCNKGP